MHCKNTFLKLLIFTLFCLFISSAFSQSFFNKRYGTASFEEGTAITVTSDSGFAVVGNTDANGAGGDIFILKLNQQGTIQWQKHIFGINQDLAKAICQWDNGSFIIGGSTFSYGSGCRDAFITEVDSNGSFVWSKAYGDVNCNEVMDLCKTFDGGFAGCGVSGGSIGYSLLFKVNQNGALQWSKWYSTGALYFVALKQTNDGGYLTASTSTLLKTDSSGNPVWYKAYSNLSYLNLELLNDGSAVLTGTNSGDILLLKINSNGDIIWSRTYGFTFNEIGLSVKNTLDNGFIISGYTNSFGHGDDDAFLLKTDSLGNFQWAKVYGDAWEDRALQVQTLPDSGYVFTGYSYSSSNYDSSYVYVVRTDQNGVTACNYLDWVPIQQTQNYTASSLSVTSTNFGVDSSCIASVLNEFFAEKDFCAPASIDVNYIYASGVIVFPNPSSGIFKINFVNQSLETTIQISDVTGNLIYQKEKIKSSEQEINLNNCYKGVYFLKIIVGDKISVSKILIQ